jgi:CBS-domain-containing membrane protein
MDTASERLASLRVADVMARKVVSLHADDSVIQAARDFVQQELSAAPVVDADGQCVGMVTLGDLLNRVVAISPASARSASAGDVIAWPSADESTLAARLEERKVYEVMNHGVQTVAPEAPVLVAARMMCVQHVHRLVVLDHEGRPIGMVSSIDIVATLVNAMEEMQGFRFPQATPVSSAE